MHWNCANSKEYLSIIFSKRKVAKSVIVQDTKMTSKTRKKVWESPTRSSQVKNKSQIKKGEHSRQNKWTFKRKENIIIKWEKWSIKQDLKKSLNKIRDDKKDQAPSHNNHQMHMFSLMLKEKLSHSYPKSISYTSLSLQIL